MKKYICNRKTYKEFIQYELNKYGKWGGVLRFIPVLFFEGQVVVRHQILLRKAELYCNTGHKLLGMIYRMRLSRLQTRYGGMTIPLNVFDKGLYVLHVGPRNINGNAFSVLITATPTTQPHSWASRQTPLTVNFTYFASFMKNGF